MLTFFFKQIAIHACTLTTQKAMDFFFFFEIIKHRAEKETLPMDRTEASQSVFIHDCDDFDDIVQNLESSQA